MYPISCLLPDQGAPRFAAQARRAFLPLGLALICFLFLTAQTASAAVRSGTKVQSLWVELGKSQWIAQGNGARILYVIFDPNCPYCHVLIDQLQPLIPELGLQVRYLVVGYLDPVSSAGKAAYILQAKNPLAALLRNEKEFNMQHFGGVPAIVPDARTRTLLRQHMDLLIASGERIVPTEIYKDRRGRVQIHHGTFDAFALDSVLQSIAK